MRLCLIVFCLFQLGSVAQAQHFSADERYKILQGDTNAMMQVIQVTKKEEYKILTTPSKEVSPFDTLLPLLSKRMYKAMRDTANPGIGIAAPQVGINRNVLWVQRFDKEKEPFEFFINPRITWRSSLMRKGKEGCLSIPDKTGNVMRHYVVQLKYQNIKGQWQEEQIEGFTAVVVQHEIDHINGILFTDRLKEQETDLYYQVGDHIDLFMKAIPKR